MKTLRIRDWNEHFENNRTRGYKRLEWVPVPNKMDGFGYVRLVSHPNGAAHLGAWVAMLEISSRQKVRGTLPQATAGFRQDAAGFAQSLAVISRLPAAIFEEAIPILIQLEWIEEVTEIPQDAAESRQATAEIPQDAALSRQDAAPSRARENGTERNGIELNGIETNGTELPNPKISSPPQAAAETADPPFVRSSPKPSAQTPVEIPDKRMNRTPPPPPTNSAALDAARIDGIRNTIWSYLRTHGVTGKQIPGIEPPDDGVVLACHNAAPHASVAEIGEYLQDLYRGDSRNRRESQAPGRPNGPKGYAWFPTVIGRKFGQRAEVLA